MELTGALGRMLLGINGSVAAPADRTTQRLGEILRQFDGDPDAARAAMDTLFVEARERFVWAGLYWLRQMPESPAMDHLSQLLATSDGMVEPVHRRLREEIACAAAMASTLAREAPLLAAKVAFEIRHRFRGEAQAPGCPDPRSWLIYQAIRESLRDGGVTGVAADLLASPSPVLRARGALMSWYWCGEAGHLRALLRDRDARVRANLIEGLWGIDTPEIRAVLREATADASHRVAANAWLGLFRLDDPDAERGLRRMARDPRKEFRTAAIWAIGQTREPAFLGLLRELRASSGSALDHQIDRAIAELERCESPLGRPALPAA